MKYLNSFYTSLLLLNLAVMPSAALAVEPVIDGTKTVNDVQGNCTSSAVKTEELGEVGQMPASAFAFDFQRAFAGIPP